MGPCYVALASLEVNYVAQAFLKPKGRASGALELQAMAVYNGFWFCFGFNNTGDCTEGPVHGKQLC